MSDSENETEEVTNKSTFDYWLDNNNDYVLDIYHELIYIYPYLFMNIKSTDFIDFLLNSYSNNLNGINYERYIYEYNKELHSIYFHINKIKSIDLNHLKYFMYNFY